MALRWFATQPIYVGYVRTHSTGDVVSDSLVAARGLAALGLVVQVDVAETDPAEVVRPVTRTEVVLRTQLHISPTPPTAPTPGTVWIQTAA